jgi:hypothetical protein
VTRPRARTFVRWWPLFLLALGACSSGGGQGTRDAGADAAPGVGGGGAPGGGGASGSGGTAGGQGTGGAGLGTGGTGGAPTGSGGGPGTGGALGSGGGTASGGAGGRPAATGGIGGGGATPGTGGVSPGTGGRPSGTGGGLGTGGAAPGTGGAAPGTGGSPGTGGASGAGGAPPGTGGAPGQRCGDGIVSGSETCDIAIAADQAGTCPWECPPLQECWPRGGVAGGICTFRCLDATAQITTVRTEPDQCCPAPGDPDCRSPYPVQRTNVDVGAGAMLGTCTQTPELRWETINTAYMPIAPTCGVPAMVTIFGQPSITDPGLGATINMLVKWIGYTTLESPNESVTYRPNYERQTSLLVDVSTASPAFVTPKFVYHGCHSRTSDVRTTAYFDARPLAGTAVETGTTARRVRVGGDWTGHFLVVEDGPAAGPGVVRLLAGRYLPARWTGTTTAQMTVASWTPSGSATLSTAGIDARDAAVATEGRAAFNTFTERPFAHVVWVEGAGGTLMYARVATDGAVTGRRALRTGTQIASPAITIHDPQRLLVVWAEQAGGKSQLRAVPLALADGAAAGAIVNITAGEGDAVEPALSSDLRSTAGLAWVDTRSGQRQLLFADLGADGVPPAAPEIVSTAAVAPADPAIIAVSASYRVAWTDSRGGGRAIYLKDNIPLSGSRPPFASEVELRVSPPGEDAHHARLPDTATNSSYAAEPLHMAWSTGTTGNQARMSQVGFNSGVYTVTSGKFGIPLSCAPSTSSLDVAWAGGDYLTDIGIGTAGQLAAWIEGDSVMILGVNMHVLGRTTVPP